MNKIISAILFQFLFSGYIDALTLTSSAFSDGGIIPTPFTYKLVSATQFRRYTCGNSEFLN